MRGQALLALAALGVGGYFIVTSFITMSSTNIIIGILIAGAGFIILGRSRNRGRGEANSFVAVDFIAVVLIAIFFLTMWIGALAGLIGNSQQTQNVAQFLLAGEAGGLILAFISGVLRFNTGVSKTAFQAEGLYIMGNFAAFFLLNLIVPPASYKFLGFALAPGSPFITLMISIPETTIFQIWLAPWLANVSRTGPIGGSFFSAVIAAAYHLFVLGTNPSALGIVFGAFFVMNFTALKSRLASVPLANHILNNFLSLVTGI